MGLIETRGATGVVEASDAMSKAAAVEVVRIQEIGGGYITVLGERRRGLGKIRRKCWSGGGRARWRTGGTSRDSASG